MIRRAGVVFIWVVATLVATTVALAAVRSVAGQVVDEPGSPLLAATGSLGLADSTSSTSSTTTQAPTSTTVVPDDGLIVVSSGPDETEEVTNTTSAPVTSTTAAPTATTEPPTTTTAGPAAETTTYQLAGGWVRITSSPGVVTLDAAGPNSGYTMEVEKAGPDEVEVKFRDGEEHSTFKASWDGGKLNVELGDESDDGGGGDD